MVKVRPYRRGGWEVDILFRRPDGSRHRERCKTPTASKSAAQRWGEDRERHLLQHGPPHPKKGAMALREYRHLRSARVLCRRGGSSLFRTAPTEPARTVPSINSTLSLQP